MEVPVLLVEFEGVIADTAVMRESALAGWLEAEGVAHSPALLALGRGYSTEDAVRRMRRGAGLADDETAVELGRLRVEKSVAARASKGLNVRPGLRETLERLAACARCAIVTRASHREVDFVLSLMNLDGIFRPVIAVEDAAPPKPATEPYFTALARIEQLFPGQQLRALAVEDSVVGVRAAREAGIASVAVGALAAHEALEADAWVESLADLTPARVRELTGVSTSGRR